MPSCKPRKQRPARESGIRRTSRETPRYHDPRAGGNHSPKTLQWHRTSLGLLQHFLQEEREITLVGEVDAPDISTWFAHLRKPPGSRGKLHAERTVQTYARAARAFFHRLVRQELILRNPFDRVVFPKVGKPLIRTIELEEFEQLLLACTPPGEVGPLADRAAARNRAILWLLYRLDDCMGPGTTSTAEFPRLVARATVRRSAMRKSAKDVILARIRGAISNAPEPSMPLHDFRERDERDRAAILEDFIDRLIDYKAVVTRIDEAGLAQSLADACQHYCISHLVVPADVPVAWLPAEVTVLRDDPPLHLTALDESSGVLTGCLLAIAQNGTIILDGGRYQGRRVLSLAPDRHLCVVRAEQIVGLVPEAIAGRAKRITHPITLISGPSATSDIELSCVEGVHGPRTLHVFVVCDNE